MMKVIIYNTLNTIELSGLVTYFNPIVVYLPNKL